MTFPFFFQNSKSLKKYEEKQFILVQPQEMPEQFLSSSPMESTATHTGR